MEIGRRLRRLSRVYSRSQPQASTTDTETVQRRRDRRSDTESTSGWLATESRSQSEVLGTILILGLSMTAIAIALAGGGVALGDLISDAESSNIENGMSHLSSKASLVALGDADSQRFSLGTTQEGTVTVRPQEGSMTITNVTGESHQTVFETDLGAIVYEGNNREIAYQGGGIWTKRGENSTMTSPPEYYYRGQTLTLPVIQVTGDGAVGGRVSGQITPVDIANNAVEGVPTPLENGTIQIEIQSEYYEGWYQFLNQRTDGSVTIYHNNKTVVSELTAPDIVTLDDPVSTQQTYDPGNNKGQGNGGGIDISPETVNDRVAHRSAKPLIDAKIRDVKDDNDGSVSQHGGTLTAGTYFVDGDLTLDEDDSDLEIDTSDGNVSIVVNGTFDLKNNEITVIDEETDNGVTYYIKDSLRAQGNAYVGTTSSDTESYRNVFYVGDEFTVDGTPTFEAIIYAPDADVDLTGNIRISGALVVNELTGGGNAKITYDTSLTGREIEVTGAADLLTYLHVSHNEIRVELN